MTRFRISVTVLAVIHSRFRRIHGPGRRFRERWRRLATAAVGSPAPAWRRGRAVARVVATPLHDDDPRRSGAPDGERDRRSGSCAADCCGPSAGRLGACAGLFGGSGHRNYLRAGAVAHGPRNGRIRLSLEPETLTRRAYAGALQRLNGWLSGRPLSDPRLTEYLGDLAGVLRGNSAVVKRWGSGRCTRTALVFPVPRTGFPCSPQKNSLFDQTNSLFRGVGNSKLKPHDISGLGGFDPAYPRPNLRNSLFFPCKTGKSGQRRGSLQTAPTATPLISLILIRFLWISSPFSAQIPGACRCSGEGLRLAETLLRGVGVPFSHARLSSPFQWYGFRGRHRLTRTLAMDLH